VRAILLFALAGLAGPALAREDRGEIPRPLPLPLPETLRGTVYVPHAGEAAGRIDSLRELYPALTACWQPPEGLAWLERTEITARFSLRADGSILGVPRITFSALPADTPARRALTDATLAAIRRCTPVALSAGMGGAIAGRPLAIRFVYEGPRGKGA
jgi:hypothetical protein